MDLDHHQFGRATRFPGLVVQPLNVNVHIPANIGQPENGMASKYWYTSVSMTHTCMPC